MLVPISKYLIVAGGLILVFTVLVIIFRLSGQKKGGTADREAGKHNAERDFIIGSKADIYIEKGASAGKIFKIDREIVTIGRWGKRNNIIQLADETVSRSQASIVFNQKRNRFSLKNESDRNPTQLNGKVIRGSRVLRHNDLIQVGKVILRFRNNN